MKGATSPVAYTYIPVVCQWHSNIGLHLIRAACVIWWRCGSVVPSWSTVSWPLHPQPEWRQPYTRDMTVQAMRAVQQAQCPLHPSPPKRHHLVMTSSTASPLINALLVTALLTTFITFAHLHPLTSPHHKARPPDQLWIYLVLSRRVNR